MLVRPWFENGLATRGRDRTYPLRSDAAFGIVNLFEVYLAREPDRPRLACR